MIPDPLPGPMGWGESLMTEDARIVQEKKEFDILADTQPAMMQYREARQPNAEKIKLVKDLMLADGITGGFSCRHVEKAVFGNFLAWLAQIIGSCVASGGARAWTRRTLIEAFLLNDPEEIFGNKIVGIDNVSHFVPYSYRAGRSYSNIRGDGSYCSIHIRGFKEYGALPCSTPGIDSDAMPEPQSARLYRSYGSSNSILTKFKDVASKFTLLESGKITSADQAKELLTIKMSPFMVCSNWAFEPDYTHATWKLSDGSPVVIYKRNRRTSWGHNMTIDGWVILINGEEFVCVDNSWGQRAHKNGSFFFIPASLYASWIKDSEQMYIGDIDLKDNEVPV